MTICWLLLSLSAVASVKSARVGIIGGGFAGLAAAAELEKNGVEYVLLEAADRLGGRVYPIIDKNGNTVQLGAEFINGVQNDIYKIAQRLNLIDHSEPDYGMFESNITYGTGGNRLSRDDLAEWNTFVGPLEDEMEKDALTFPEISVGDYFQRKYNNFLENHPGKQGIFDGLASVYRSYYENEWSSPVNELALDNFQEWDDGTNDATSWYLKGEGFGAILRELINNVSATNIRLNSRVSQIDWSKNDYVTIVLENTEDTLYFDCVIVTVPLGHLKRFPKLFQPKLPNVKQQAIQYLGFGNLQKVFLVYDKPWWQPNTETLVAIKLANTSGDSKLADTFSIFQVLQQKPNKIVFRILLLWFAGEGPKLSAKMSNSELAGLITYHLKQQFNNISIPYPKDIYTYNWYADDLIGGAYSYITPASYENLDDSIADMAAPVKKDGSPLICFAGEHTHQTMYQTTVGAYESGIREARRLINEIQKHKGII